MKTLTPASACGKTWFVSRHCGAIEWVRRQGLAVDRWIAHLDPAEVRPGDTVIGALPVHLAAEVCWRGARYLHLRVAIPQESRGRELTARDLTAAGCTLVAFHVEENR